MRYVCYGTVLSERVPSAEVVKNWSDESAFSTADVEERVLSALRHVGVYMDIVQWGIADELRRTHVYAICIWSYGWWTEMRDLQCGPKTETSLPPATI